MEKKIIKINNQEISYIFKKYKLSRRLKIIIKSDATVVLSAPRFFSEKRALKFLREKADWVSGRVEFFEKQQNKREIKISRDDFLKKKEEARSIILKKIKELNKNYNFKYGRVSIRNQKTRWGSCSKQGNLNFNYRLIYLSGKLLDYIVVHELCHLKEMNHSSRFWDLVAKTIPDYRERRGLLRKRGLELF